MRSGEPGFEMHLTERLARKCEFLNEVVRKTEAPVTVHHGPIEWIEPLSVEVVTARACAPLSQLLPYYQRHSAPGCVALFAKGRNVSEELTQANRTWRLDVDMLPSRTGSGGQILRIRSAKQRSNGH